MRISNLRRAIARITCALLALAPLASGAAPAARAAQAVAAVQAAAPADSTAPESQPGPLLIPGRPSGVDSTKKTPTQRAQEAYLLGRKLESIGRYGPAIVSYRNAVRIVPGYLDANYRMGMLYLERDRVDQAVKYLLIEVKHHPDNLDAQRELGVCYARFGDFPRAITQLEGLSRDHPKDAAIWHALGSVYLAAGRPGDAEATLGRALKLAPDSPEVLRDLGATLAAGGRDAEARVYYRRALALDPRDAATWLNLGNIERRASHPDSALALYRRAEAADSAFVPALEAQAQMLGDGQHESEVLAIHLRRLRQHPNHHGSRLEAIRILEERGSEAEALALAREGTEKVPDDGQSFLILGMVLRAHGDIHGAMTALYRAQRKFTSNPKERDRVTKTIAAIRASAPDSMQASFTADSLASLARPRR